MKVLVHRLRRFAFVIIVASPWAATAECGGLGGRGAGVRASIGGGRPSVGARASFGGAGSGVGNVRPNVNTGRTGFGGGGSFPMQRPQTSSPHLGASGNLNHSNLSVPSQNRSSFGPGRRDEAERRSISTGRSNAVVRPDAAVRPNNLNVPSQRSRPVANTNRPAMPDFGKLPSGRPSAGELGDFLGVDPPTRPASNPSRPMLPAGNRDTGFERPNIGEKVGQRDTLPAVVRPDRNHGLSPRPEPGNRLAPDRRPDIQIGDVNIGNNNVISNKPRWATIDNNRVSAINRRWSNQLNSATTLPARVPGRFQDWGDAIRDHWSGSHYPGYFRPDWWARHQFRCSGWHYFYAYTYYPYTYWWGTPTYNDVVTWCNLNAAASVASQPVYYDYGNSGNVIYQENQVYIEGQAVAGADEFAQSAALLSTVDEPEDTKDAEEAEWMPLGTFALTADPADVNPSRIVQLAVNRQGIVSGTLYNNDTDQLQAIQGRVDKDTQRVAMRLGESEDVVVETGLYNLTQDEASVLVHYGSENHDEYLLVRLPSPEVSASGN